VGVLYSYDTKRLVNDLNRDTQREVCCCRIRYVGL